MKYHISLQLYIITSVRRPVSPKIYEVMKFKTLNEISYFITILFYYIWKDRED